jgi:hypothetical protein
MKVIMNASIRTGIRIEGVMQSYQVGQVCDLPDKLAKEYIAQSRARVYVEPEVKKKGK